MKLWIDDLRTTKEVVERIRDVYGIVEDEEWTGSQWPAETIEILKTGKVTVLSLDHDLGDKTMSIVEGRKERTGKVVIEWLEDQVFNHGFVPPATIYVHSMNPNEARIMRMIAERIKRHYQSKET